MKNQSNYDYGQTDPDFIDQNTLIDGTFSNEDQYKVLKKEDEQLEFGESDPDHIDQNTLVDNDNYARDEDPYQYQEEFVEDLSHPEQDFEVNKNVRSDNDPNGEPILNDEEQITNDEDNEESVDNSLEKDGDLYDDENTKDTSDEDLYKVSHDPFPGTNPGSF